MGSKEEAMYLDNSRLQYALHKTNLFVTYSSCSPKVTITLFHLALLRLSQVACHCRERLPCHWLSQHCPHKVTELISRYTLSILLLVVLVMMRTVYCLLRGRPMKTALLYHPYLTNLTTENCCGRQRPCSAEK